MFDIVRPGSAGRLPVVSDLRSGYGLTMPHVGTSVAIYDLRAPIRTSPTARPRARAAQQTAHPVLRSAADQVRDLLAALALNKSQLADVLRVTRPTLYEWLEGNEPRADNAERLSTLTRLLARAGVSGAEPLLARFVRQPLDEGGTSLLEVLSAPTLDESAAALLLSRVRGLVSGVRAQANARDSKRRTQGFAELSDDDRRSNLALNVALRDWPKDGQ